MKLVHGRVLEDPTKDIEKLEPPFSKLTPLAITASTRMPKATRPSRKRRYFVLPNTRPRLEPAAKSNASPKKVARFEPSKLFHPRLRTKRKAKGGLKRNGIDLVLKLSPEKSAGKKL